MSLLLVTGCDFFRTLAGRPTSEDIEKKKVEILRQEQEMLQARLDSIRREQQIVQDSIAALDSIRQYGGTILNPAKLGGLFATKLEARSSEPSECAQMRKLSCARPRKPVMCRL